MVTSCSISTLPYCASPTALTKGSIASGELRSKHIGGVWASALKGGIKGGEMQPGVGAEARIELLVGSANREARTAESGVGLEVGVGVGMQARAPCSSLISLLRSVCSEMTTLSCRVCICEVRRRQHGKLILTSICRSGALPAARGDGW
jgi:hypothetical protein